MNDTPKALRLHIGIFGRRNAGKSSFVNLVTGQATSIVSPVPGTTTDVVKKSMELLPIGPVTFLDTAGIDDEGELGSLRTERTRKALLASDVAVIVAEPNRWTAYEEGIASDCVKQGTPVIIAVNKIDAEAPSAEWLGALPTKIERVIMLSCERAEANPAEREATIVAFKRSIMETCPEAFLRPPPLLGDLLRRSGSPPLVVLITPIDSQAPRGRLILPQVQAIRDALDSNAICLVVKETEYRASLAALARPPDLVVCDSQVVDRMAAETDDGVPCTTFSILFSRVKGDIVRMARGAAAIFGLVDGDRVLIAEACTHHALEDDIGRVKLPRWLRERTGADISIEHSSGKEYPEDLGAFSLVIHCGACTLTRRETLLRIEAARSAGVPVTNYGIAISALRGAIERTLSPFPEALREYRSALGRMESTPIDKSLQIDESMTIAESVGARA